MPATRSLLPAPDHAGARNQPSSASRQQPQVRPKRVQVSVACEVCRRRKAKCDGIRPSCHSCLSKNLECFYSADPDATRQVTLKRKFETVNNRKEELEALVDSLRNRPPVEANCILNGLRSGMDASQCLSLVCQDHVEPAGVSPATSSPSLDAAHVRGQRVEDEDEHEALRRDSGTGSVKDRMRLEVLLSDPNALGEQPVSPCYSINGHAPTANRSYYDTRSLAWR